MTLEELYAEWGKDSPIDQTELGSESVKVHDLKQKYLKLLSMERMRYRALTEKKRILENTLEDYYEGKIDGKEIGREPFPLIVRTNEKLKRLIAADDEMVKLNLQCAVCEEKNLYLKDIVTDLSQRSYNFRNAIDWLKFTSGNN
jgi:hypothetical protein